MLKFTIVTICVLGLIVAPFFLFGDKFELLFSVEGPIVWFQNQGKLAGFIGAGLLVADLLFPIPTTTVMATLGMVYGAALGGVIAFIGSIFSALLGYILCRTLGRPVTLFFTGEKGLAYGEHIFEKFGGILVVSSRWLPIACEVVSCIAGLSKMPFWNFFIAIICGTLPMSFVFSTIGSLGIDSPVSTLLISAVIPIFLWLIVHASLKKLQVLKD